MNTAMKYRVLFCFWARVVSNDHSVCISCEIGYGRVRLLRVDVWDQGVDHGKVGGKRYVTPQR